MRHRPSYWFVIASTLLAGALSAGCRPPVYRTQGSLAPSPTAGYPKSIKSFDGSTVFVPTRPSRIVSLAPSVTEILFAIGAGDRVVGDTTACDFPPQAKSLPHVGGNQLSVEAITALNPDLVIGDSSLGRSQLDAKNVLTRSNVPVLLVTAKSVSDVIELIQTVGTAVDESANADRVLAEMRAKLDATRTRVSKSALKPTVFICYGVRPTVYTTGPGSFIDDLITVAGGRNIVTTQGAAGSTISSELVAQLQPDVIIASPDVQPEIRTMPAWSAIPAVRNNRFFQPSDPDLLVRAGPRLAQGAEELAKYLHPEAFATPVSAK